MTQSRSRRSRLVLGPLVTAVGLLACSDKLPSIEVRNDCSSTVQYRVLDEHDLGLSAFERLAPGATARIEIGDDSGRYRLKIRVDGAYLDDNETRDFVAKQKGTFIAPTKVDAVGPVVTIAGSSCP